MKSFLKTELPESIAYQGDDYTYNAEFTALYREIAGGKQQEYRKFDNKLKLAGLRGVVVYIDYTVPSYRRERFIMTAPRDNEAKQASAEARLYYRNQLERLGMDKFGAKAKFQFTSNDDDAKTNWMDLNKESAAELIKFLKPFTK